MLAALFATFPLLLAVQAGRISDRFGVRIPIVCGALTMAAGLALAFTVSEIHWLFVCPALIGLGHIFFHVSIHNLVGCSAPKPSARAISRPSPSAARSLRSSDRRSPASPSTRPASAFAILAVVAAARHRRSRAQPDPGTRASRGGRAGQERFDLLAIPALRRTLIMSGVTLTGIELSSSTCRSTAARSASRLR